ncbi:MAG: F0F1 ATP synthase subunit B [Cellulosilyticaceae bacterium]
MSKIIEFSWSTLFELGIQWIALLLIIFVMAKLLFKPVTEFLEKRQAFIKGELDEATAKKADANALKDDYENKLKNIEDEANALLSDARTRALKREEEIIAEAKKEAEAIKARAMEDIKLEEARVRSEMKQEMIEVAGLMAGKFVETSMDETKQQQLIDEMMKEMGDVQWLS